MSQRIVFITGSIDPTIGGVERVTWCLSTFFESINYECFYIYYGEDSPIISSNKKLHLEFFKCKNEKEFYNKFRTFIIENGISIIINQDYYTSPLLYSLREIKKEFNIKLFFCYHRNPLFEDVMNGYDSRRIILKNTIKRLINKKVYYPGFVQLNDICDRYVVLSKSYINLFSKRFDIEKKRIISINNPIPFDSHYEFDIGSKEKMVLIVTRFVEKIKNIKASIRIWKQIEEWGYDGWNLVIAGYGKDEEEIKNYANILGLKSCSFIGKLEDPTSYYKKSAVLMMTSNCEGYPMTIIEAMQFGCVPIAFNNYSSLKDIINNNINGIIVPSKKEGCFSKKLFKLMNNNSFRISLALNAVESSKFNSIENIGQCWIKLFDTLP